MIFYLYNTYYAYYDYIEKLVKELKSIEYQLVNTLINVRLSVLKLDKRIKIFRCRNNI